MDSDLMWEYMTWVIAYPQDSAGGQVKYINGREVPDWKKGARLAELLNEAGSDDWELVTIFSARPEGMASADIDPTYIFKRPRQRHA